MLSAMILFGLNLTPLYNAIANVESGRGATSENVYQIRNIYVQDVNRIYELHNGMEYHHRDVFDKDKSEMMMWLYWKHYGYLYAKETGRKPTFAVLAMMHNRGGRYWKQGKQVQLYALQYWKKVEKELKKGGWSEK